MVECDLAKVEVAGSNPVSRSRFPVPAGLCAYWTFSSREVNVLLGRGTQVVRERSAKPLCVGSIPTRASNLFLRLLDFAGLHPLLTVRSGSASIG